MNKQNNEIVLYDRVIKRENDFNMWFAFPGPESFAMSSLGYLWLYRAIDMLEDINIERCLPLEQRLKNQKRYQILCILF